MSDAVIEAEHLSKSYLIGHQGRGQGRGGYVALRDVIAGGARNFARKAGDFFAGRQIVQGDEIEEFWALNDVGFTVKQGQLVGIIGRNGAGKSTLLKILSRITEPTEGRVTIKGRVASLLEVGTGFHPELTGRENIYLNGAILGMARTEIRRKFDEIVAFAEVEQFLDTPVKRYSSGMYVRLAFAVAAHLEPEILLIDEVLAVGDSEFQKKCLGRLNDVARDGRTVLFVSHNLAALRRTCEFGIVLSQGRIAKYGSIDECVDSYLGLMKPSSDSRLVFPLTGKNRYYIVDIQVLDEQLNSISRPTTWQPIVFSIRFHSPIATPNAAVTFQISTLDGFLVTFCATRPDQDFDIAFSAGENVVHIRFDSLALSAGSYVIGAGLAIANTRWLYNEPHGAIMEVAPRDVYNAGLAPALTRYPVPMQCRWELVQPQRLAMGDSQSNPLALSK